MVQVTQCLSECEKVKDARVKMMQEEKKVKLTVQQVRPTPYLNVGIAQNNLQHNFSFSKS